MVEIPEDVKHRRASNFSLPIFRLGDDILRLIFTINSHIGVPLFTFERTSSSTSGLTTRITSQVCFQWRLLCLSSSILWSNIDISDSRYKWRDKVLLRSAQSSVALTYFDESVDGDEDFVLLLPRLRTFIGNINKWSVLINEMKRPGSQLRSIVLHQMPGGNSVTDFFRIGQTHSYSLPLTLLAIHTGNITNLDFRMLSNLTSLAVISVRCDGSTLLHGLMQMSALTELSLRGMSCKDVPSEPDIVVSLPNLTHLEIVGVESHSVLLYLAIPATCVIWIDCDMLLNCESLLPVLSKSAHQLTSAGHQSLNLTVRRTFVAFSNTPVGFQHSLKNRMRHSIVKFHLHCVRQNVEEWTYSLHECLSLLFEPGYMFSSVKTLQLHTPYLRATDNPPFPLRLFRNITTLFLESNTLGWLLSVISENDENRMLFPSLKRLVLTVNADLSHLDALISYLAWRCEHYTCIDVLELRYVSNGERRISEVTLAQCDKLESLDVAVDLFYIIEERYLVRTVFVKAPVDSCKDHVYELKPLESCS